MGEYATAATIVGVAFAVAETIIRLNKNNSSPCSMHNTVVEGLKESLQGLKEWMTRLEKKMDDTMAACVKNGEK